MLAALERGETATYFLFDEGIATMLARSAALGMDLAAHRATGRLTVTQVYPAELSPGEFASQVRAAVEQRGSTFVGIDSLNAYLHAMPGEQFLILQMHELLSYMNQRGVTTLLVLGQHGVVGEVRSDIDLSYLSDGIVLFRFFEAQGRVRSALSVVKSRVNAHEHEIREFRLSAAGLQVGEALTDFQGVLAGLPVLWRQDRHAGRCSRAGDGGVRGGGTDEDRVLVLAPRGRTRPSSSRSSPTPASPPPSSATSPPW